MATTAKEAIAPFRLWYFVIAGFVLMAFGVIVQNDEQILYAFEHGQTEPNSLANMILPFSSSDQAYSVRMAVIVTVFAMFIMAGIVYVTNRRKG